MIEQIEAHGFMNSFSLKADTMLSWLNTYFAGVDNVRIISFVLLMLAIILFLFSVVVVCVRHIINIVKNNSSAKVVKDDEGIESLFGFDDEAELERELQRELEFAATEQQRREQEALQLEEKERVEREAQERIEKENKERKEKESQEQSEREQKEADIFTPKQIA